MNLLFIVVREETINEISINWEEIELEKYVMVSNLGSMWSIASFKLSQQLHSCRFYQIPSYTGCMVESENFGKYENPCSNWYQAAHATPCS